MSFTGYPYRKQYAIVKQRISQNMIGTIELLDIILGQNNIWYARCLNHKIIEPGTEVCVIGQNERILLVEPAASA